ncbi:hypothetical protein [Streptomyces sp. NPDC051098]
MALLVLATVLTGCGSLDEREAQVRTAAERFTEAVASKNAVAVC